MFQLKSEGEGTLRVCETLVQSLADSIRPREMCSPQHSQEDEPSDPPHSHPQSQSETQTMEEESQNPQIPEIPQNQESQQQVIPEEKAIHQQQEDPKSSLEENPDQQSSGKALSLPTAIHVDVPHNGGDMSCAPLTSPNNPQRRLPKRKKGKCNAKKQQAIDRRLNALLGKLHPIPFIPSKILDFCSHEKLLKELGLWEFVHIEFNQKVRVDLIAQLVATYDAKSRRSCVNGEKIAVSRADLARALRLPVKKEKGGGNANADVVNADDVTLSEEKIGFIEDFVSIWVLLHDDTWMMPNEVLNWIRVIKDGSPEKVDWAGLVWFMVEKELIQGEQLEDCYYAVHLQYLIKSQHEEVFFCEESEKAELGVEVKEEEEDGDVKVGGATEGQDEESVLRGPNIELSLGQDVDKTEEVMDVEEHVGEQLEEEQEQWALGRKNEVGEPYLRLCTSEGMILDDHEEKKEESEDLVDEEGVGGDCGEEQEREDGFTGIFIQTREMSQIPFCSDGHLHDQSSIELVASGTDLNTSGPSFGCGSKREVEHNHDGAIAHQSHGGNKRLRIEGPSDNMPSDFGTVMEQMQQWMTKARMMYEAKEQTEGQLNIYKQMLLDECHKRENVIDLLHRTKLEELQKRDSMIYRLEHELFMMGNIVEGYRKALKDTHKAFAEYRQRVQLPEEPIYKDAGPGGLVLSTAEIEKLRLKQEEEYRSNCLMLQLKAKEAEEGYAAEFEMYMDKVTALGIRLMSISSNVEELKEMYAKRNLEAHQKALELEAPDPSTEE